MAVVNERLLVANHRAPCVFDSNGTDSVAAFILHNCAVVTHRLRQHGAILFRRP